MSPPSLTTLATRAFRGETRIAPGESVLLAVSGGPDSMALLHVTALVAQKRGFRVFAHGVDHGLRREAAAELDLAASFAATLGVPFTRTTLAVRPGGNLQARARTVRYAALVVAARACGASGIATAHHADDRAETVLLRLLRGAGPAGLAALPPVAPCPGAGDLRLLRPLLRATRAAVRLHNARHGVPSAEDPSNLDARFARVRVRRELLPLLLDLSPQIVSHLTALADALGDEAWAAPTSTYPGLPPLVLGRRHRALLDGLRSSSSKAAVRLPSSALAGATVSGTGTEAGNDAGLVVTFDRTHNTFAMQRTSLTGRAGRPPRTSVRQEKESGASKKA